MAKLERTKNATRNIYFGLVLKAYQILVPFIMRTAIIYLMGVQYLGLNSLFASVLQVLNLAELGVGSAMVYSMYKPIAEDDQVTICALMKLYRTYYRIIGSVIALVGIAIIPFLPKLINGDVPDGINIYIIYIINLSATVLSYWLFAYKNSILQAHQRVDVTSKVSLVTNTIQYVIQILVLWMFHNYYLFVIVTVIVQVLTNILIAKYVDKYYPQFRPNKQLPKEEIMKINHRIIDLFTAKFGSVVVGAVDTIVISTYLGLTSLAIYQNYYFVLNSICGIISVFFTSITAGIGNSLVTESVEKNYNDFTKFSFIICFMLCVCTCCLAGLYQPFMEMWVGKDLMLDYSFVVLFCVLFYCLELSMIWATIKDAAGLWHSDKFRPLVGAIANLLLNIYLVDIIGLYGVILSTVLSYVFISMPWLIHNLFKLLYKNNIRNYIKDIFLYIGITIFLTCFCAYICFIIEIEGVFGLIIKGVACVIIPTVVQCLFFYRKREFKESIALVSKILKRG